MPETVYPESFFNLPHPSSPFISVQVRTEIEPQKDIDDPSHWEEITFNPNNFFNNITIEDSGGVYKITLNLFDKNFAYIEDTIVRSIIATRLANSLVEDPDYSVEEDFFEFFITKTNSANLRIRFGYSEYSLDDYISETSFTSERWKNRASENVPVLKSPWIYFQMSNADFNLTPKGLEVQINAFSVMSNFLQKAKLVETYARFYGTPEYVISHICDKISRSAERSGETITYEIRGEPRGYPSQENGEEIIEIMLGGEPTITGRDENGNYVFETKYKNLSTILGEICSNVRPLKYDEEGNRIPFTSDTGSEAEGMEEENEEAAQVFRYSYYINETETETQIIFDYQDPNRGLEQENVRTYIWLQEGNSIIKNLDIKTNSDFSALSVPIINVNPSDGSITGQVLRGNSSSGSDEDNVDFNVGHAKDVTDALEDEGFESVFVRHITSVGNENLTNGRESSKFLAARIADGIAANLNQQVFKGTLTLFGDPFYLFDDTVQPYAYLIKIIVNRPNYVDDEGNFVAGGKSYLSGYYAIKNITHEISLSGFETQLEIMKFNSHGR